MMLFHVPSNVSSFINCGSKSACEKQEIMGGFAAWYSCPVCAYRSVKTQVKTFSLTPPSFESSEICV